MRNQKVNVFDMFPVTTQMVSAADFYSLPLHKREGIKVISIVPPRIGCNDFGKVMIKRKYPLYRVFE